ncbi:ParB/RepB/Spo0J family partition protein [Quisquiliibacterium transsilvanicum]|uniref:ParB family chromosome partitioning protein n=1 Tax=Quisquiliibacterium transsilvanicum TaxID=1549638 RepID=A0A7W8HIS9_9BURK|nr:ParB/RepB/Spo0J family partition protein [Quisquiliibacterium transsilvanicum]MBB5272647.1 ParB family chromosome partitioning protein [Quisquiliibacterium transsilvanicum]
MSKVKSKGLGRGLDALLGADAPAMPAPGQDGPGPVLTLPVGRMQPGRYQPRTRMDESALQELAASIRQHGMMQPIVVRPLAGASGAAARYEIIAGERRFRAAQAAGLSEVPVTVRDVSDQQALAMALIENIQREDLNPLEQAQAVKRLIDEFDYSHEQAAEAIGRSRSATSNLLRLLNLADPVQTMLLAGDLDMGHARALLAVDRATQIMLANQVVQKRLSVREAEKLVARTLAAGEGTAAGRGRRAGEAPDRDIARLQEHLSDLLGTTVQVRQAARGRGQLLIDFSGPEQFDGLLQRMGLSLLRD